MAYGAGCGLPIWDGAECVFGRLIAASSADLSRLGRSEAPRCPACSQLEQLEPESFRED